MQRLKNILKVIFSPFYKIIKIMMRPLLIRYKNWLLYELHLKIDGIDAKMNLLSDSTNNIQLKVDQLQHSVYQASHDFGEYKIMYQRDLNMLKEGQELSEVSMLTFLQALNRKTVQSK